MGKKAEFLIKSREGEFVASFIKFLMSIKQAFNTTKLYIYFHNFGKFDSMFLLRHLPALAVEFNFSLDSVKLVVREGTVYELSFLDFIFLDSYLLTRLSLNELGQMFCDNVK